MGLQVIRNETHLDSRGGKVVLACDNTSFPNAIEELQSAAARKLACDTAAKAGVGDPRVNNMGTRAYPVDHEGQVVQDQQKQAIAGYRVDIDVVPRIG